SRRSLTRLLDRWQRAGAGDRACAGRGAWWNDPRREHPERGRALLLHPAHLCYPERRARPSNDHRQRALAHHSSSVVIPNISSLTPIHVVASAISERVFTHTLQTGADIPLAARYHGHEACAGGPTQRVTVHQSPVRESVRMDAAT